MPKLKLAPMTDDKPVKLTLELPASLHRDLVAYADILANHAAGGAHDPVRLIVPMLERFIASDRAFHRTRKAARPPASED